MMQFYFLSIIANIAAGLALTADYLSERMPSLTPLRNFFLRTRVRAVTGGTAFIVGFLKLLIYSTVIDVPVVGDLLPALAGMGAGFSLIFDMYKDRTRLSARTIESIERAVLTYRIPLGLAAMAVAVLHFFLPGALFL
jgi:hypothetical protein